MENKHTQQVDFSNPNANKITSGTTNKSVRNKQTAVEWLHEIAKQREPDKFDWQQAKAMEKEQIIDAREDGIKDGYGDYVDTEWGKDTEMKASEQYYNETYGK